MEVIDIIESSCKSCKDQGEKTEHLKRKPTEGIAIRDFWLRRTMHDVWQIYNGILYEKRAAKVRTLVSSVTPSPLAPKSTTLNTAPCCEEVAGGGGCGRDGC
jgi:hypothetical protein